MKNKNKYIKNNRNQLEKSLEALRYVKRKKHNALIHQIHKKHKISRKTLFYIKEYGPETNVSKTIIKESIKILIFASIISSLGGIALENIKTLFVSIVPFIILLPVLNDMIGDFGTITSSRLATIFHEGKIKNNWLTPETKKLFLQIIIIATFGAFFSSLIAIIISLFTDYKINFLVGIKIITITLLDVLFLTILLFLAAVFAGLYVYRKSEDPNNFLIPITTSIADFGNMIVLALLVYLFF
ncbi:MAG: magnesium transporter [Candidatus Woesearchaeota archaeon]